GAGRSAGALREDLPRDREDDRVPLRPLGEEAADRPGRLHGREQWPAPAHLRDPASPQSDAAHAAGTSLRDARDLQEAGQVLLPLPGRSSRPVRDVRDAPRRRLRCVKARPAIVRAAAVAAATIAAAGIGGAEHSRATTAPGVVSVSKLVITDSAVMIRIR